MSFINILLDSLFRIRLCSKNWKALLVSAVLASVECRGSDRQHAGQSFAEELTDADVESA